MLFKINVKLNNNEYLYSLILITYLFCKELSVTTITVCQIWLETWIWSRIKFLRGFDLASTAVRLTALSQISLDVFSSIVGARGVSASFVDFLSKHLSRSSFIHSTTFTHQVCFCWTSTSLDFYIIQGKLILNAAFHLLSFRTTRSLSRRNATKYITAKSIHFNWINAISGFTHIFHTKLLKALTGKFVPLTNSKASLQTDLWRNRESKINKAIVAF